MLTKLNTIFKNTLKTALSKRGYAVCRKERLYDLEQKSKQYEAWRHNVQLGRILISTLPKSGTRFFDLSFRQGLGLSRVPLTGGGKW